VSSAIVGEHRKPLFVLNYKGFYEPLKQQIEHMRSLRFIPEQEAYKPVFIDSMEALKEEISTLKKQ